MTDNLSMNQYEAVLRFIGLHLEKRGWKPAKLAKEMGMSSGWISKVMHGEIRLSVERLLQIAEILMVPPASLLPVNDDKNKDEFTTLPELIRQIVKEEIERTNSPK